MDGKITVIRSNRKSLSLEIGDKGIIVRAPQRMSDSEINRFINSRKDWIERHLKKLEERRRKSESVEQLSDAEIRELAERARKVIPERVRHYAPLVGVTYGRITIRAQKSRWGSCSSAGNLNFNCLLMLAPPEVLDSVVVHELCHRKEMNHSAKFYAEVLRVFPDYRRCEKWLKDNGALLQARVNREDGNGGGEL